MPNVVLEAMAAGLPVVSTQVEGVAEVLGPDWQTQSAPFGDSQVFLEKLFTIASDRSLAEQIGQRNRQRAERHFSWETVIAAYESLYDDLLQGRVCQEKK
jgi:starch synthase (maltosyl-transferring)